MHEPVPSACPPAWRRLHPLPDWHDPTLARIAAEMDRPSTLDEIAQLEEKEEYPHGLLERLYNLGLASILVEPEGLPPEQSTMTPYHLYALNAILARHSGALAITVGVNFLGLLPVWIAGSAAQLRRVGRRIQQGAFVSMAISEIDRGSDILRNQTSARRGALDEHGQFVPSASAADPFTHYCVQGEKTLINGATFHDLFITFTRTREQQAGTQLGDLRAFSFFIIARDPTVKRPRRWHTLPARAADISSVRFADTVVSKENLLGREGSGFELLQKTLSMSRGGVGMIASGTASRARELAVAYAHERKMDGVEIVRMGAVAHHLLKLEALDLVVAATATKAGAMLNSLGVGAAHYSAVAKFLCCVLTEEAVAHGERVLSARALLREGPYERLMRDAPLYGVFEGTTHIMLDRLSSRLKQLTMAEVGSSSIEELRQIYCRPARRMLEVCREPAARQYLVKPDVHARRLAALDGAVPLAPLVAAAEGLLAIAAAVRPRWDEENGLRFELAEQFALLEGLFVLIELGDPGRRAALGMAPVLAGGHGHEEAYRYAVGDLGSRLCRGLRAIAVRVGAQTPQPLERAEEAFLDGHEAARARLHARLVG